MISMVNQYQYIVSYCKNELGHQLYVNKYSKPEPFIKNHIYKSLSYNQGEIHREIINALIEAKDIRTATIKGLDLIRKAGYLNG